jgi:hypothetical protein
MAMPAAHTGQRAPRPGPLPGLVPLPQRGFCAGAVSWQQQTKAGQAFSSEEPSTQLETKAGHLLSTPQQLLFFFCIACIASASALFPAIAQPVAWSVALAPEGFLRKSSFLAVSNQGQPST